MTSELRAKKGMSQTREEQTGRRFQQVQGPEEEGAGLPRGWGGGRALKPKWSEGSGGGWEDARSEKPLIQGRVWNSGRCRDGSAQENKGRTSRPGRR